MSQPVPPAARAVHGENTEYFHSQPRFEHGLCGSSGNHDARAAAGHHWRCQPGTLGGGEMEQKGWGEPAAEMQRGVTGPALA